ncbi:MAG TPA: sigma-70 family RNA polymerase sigma factor [Herpetosiphonaceae bacterium]|nr:sigma-70 family RNA polymerase sigma factor [Herpetosiphonaceae bacterium]
MSHPLRLTQALFDRAAGEKLTLDSVYRRYRQPIERYLTQLSGSPDLAEDLTQETFARVCASFMSFRGECSLATWLFRIARNTYLNSARRPDARRIDTDELLAIPDEQAYGDPVLSYASAEQRSVIEIVLAQLPERQRSLLLLRDSEDLAYAEIAEVLGLSISAVKVNIFRARLAFRQLYAHYQTGALNDDRV